MNHIPKQVFHDYSTPVAICIPDTQRAHIAPPEPRYTMVEVGPEAIPALEQHWQSGQPIDLLGVVFEFAVIARTISRRFRADRYVVRGMREG